MKTAFITLVLGLCFVPSLAFAQDRVPDQGRVPDQSEASPPAEGAEPRMNLGVAPPGPPTQRSAYVHEGFYFRFDMGPGFQYTNLSSNQGLGSIDGGAFAVGADLLVGGSPSPGMALGGGVLANVAFDGLSNSGVSSGPLVHFLAGPFFDAFPNDKRGWHLGTMVGFAGMTLGDAAVGPTDAVFGGGAAAFAGYDLWVAPDWSVGFNTRLEGGYMVGSDADAGVFSALFMVTILNH